MDIEFAKRTIDEGYHLKLGVIGTRDFTYDYLLDKWIRKVKNKYSVEIIVSGGKRPDGKGADTLAENWCDINTHPKLIFPPDTHTNSNRHYIEALLDRNTQIANYSDFLLAFWDGKSTGTVDTMNKAWDRNKITFVFNYTTDKIEIFKP